MLKYCEICGKPFNAAGTAKYCSATCRQEAAHRNRKAWEERTGYRDKRRLEAQEYNQEQLEAAEKQAKEDEKRRKRNERRRANYKRKKQEAARKSAAATGALAAMREAKRFSFEYWEAYKEYSLQVCGNECARTVNGIPITDEEFALKVIMTIEEDRCIVVAPN